MRNGYKTLIVRPQLDVMTSRLKQKRAELDFEGMKVEAQKMKDFLKCNKIRPYFPFLLIGIQMPIFISIFMALKKIIDAPVSSLKSGGFFWFTDLTVADPLNLLPCFAALGTLFSMNSSWKCNPIHTSFIGFQTPLRILTLASVPITVIMGIPSGIILYWMGASAASFIQFSLLRNSILRHKLNLPSISLIRELNEKLKPVVPFADLLTRKEAQGPTPFEASLKNKREYINAVKRKAAFNK
ncbi:mitochondrial inner membrane protein OXA1L-like [Zophobas morio]|uniref:mitochondrial inner membrane protein OXA1L-like n=1 Tax=Zophobas morio TaxID=2755281 RepID=UPI0030832CB7